MATTDHITTAQQLAEASGTGRYELIRGDLVMMSPSGFEHGCVVSNINGILREHVMANQLGAVTGAETGFQISHDPDTVRAPDVGFVRQDRVPPTAITGFFPGAPDLAVEVLSPNDRARDVQAKVRDWLDAGCHQVWVVDPRARTVTLHSLDDQQQIFEATDVLESGNLLPGLRTRIDNLFAR